ncbi:MAG TPA: adenosylcobinamide-phosphate synthase CbiB, partial [Acetobacteraceae bacterium]|nr:adenosylcobinamide-phosphate synthase CbiB [Acetobacteraceae bacterium]
MQIISNVELALAALLVEAAVGYPAMVYRAIGHPVTWIGALLSGLDKRLNSPLRTEAIRRALGVLTLVVPLGVAAGAAFALTRVLSFSRYGAALLVLAATSLLAQRSLYHHVRTVADGLERNGLDAGRAEVAKIVGRDPAVLDVAGVARAAIESLAENFSDGVVAPAFWLALAGLPGAAVYKAANTADSMIGHRTERYAAFGWAAARFDDVVNLPASRLAALLLILAAVATGMSPISAARAVWHDASRHRSPNAGWPEAAMAGALGLSLAGPRVYAGVRVDDVFMGNGRRDATAADIRRALLLYRVACFAG